MAGGRDASLSELLSVFVFKQVEPLLRRQPFLQTLEGNKRNIRCQGTTHKNGQVFFFLRAGLSRIILLSPSIDSFYLGMFLIFTFLEFSGCKQYKK